MKPTITIRLVALLIALTIQQSVQAQQNSLINILDEELQREFIVLSEAEYPAYYMDYHVQDVKKSSIRANLGSLISTANNHQRLAKANVRVGDYQIDNTHDVGQGIYNSGYGGMMNALPISLDDNSKAIAQNLWMLTNIKYRQAEDRFKKVAALDVQSMVPDFSIVEPDIFIGDLKEYDLSKDQNRLEELLVALSAQFLQNDDIINGEVSLERDVVTKYFVSSEGSKIAHQLEYNYLMISALIRDAEGALIPLHQTYFSYTLDGLPSASILRNDIEQMKTNLVALQSAPYAEPYTGPAILDPKVAGVFFHEIFGHRIEGSRLSSEFDSQTFKEKVGELVLPKNINVSMDPTISQLQGKDLLGYYRYDDEGVKGKKTNVVEQGQLKGFLMTRKPLNQFSSSNGHARAQGGMEPVSRQSNLIVESSKVISAADLRKRLIKACKRQDKEYGYFFKEVTGGFTNTDRFSPNAFNIMPTLVYRVFVDGRPDELVRGVDLIGTPLSMFAEISATSDVRATFNGYCGAESGNVPVSATAPGLMVRRIETQKKYRNTNEESAPILSRPLNSK